MISRIAARIAKRPCMEPGRSCDFDQGTAHQCRRETPLSLSGPHVQLYSADRQVTRDSGRIRIPYQRYGRGRCALHLLGGSRGRGASRERGGAFRASLPLRSESASASPVRAAAGVPGCTGALANERGRRHHTPRPEMGFQHRRHPTGAKYGSDPIVAQSARTRRILRSDPPTVPMRRVL